MRAIITLALGLALAAWSLAAISVDAETTPFLNIATRVEQSGIKDMGFLERVDRVLAATPGRTPCPREFLHSAVTIKLARLEGAYRKEYPFAWAGLALEADTLLRGALDCFPHDGNLWLQLAMVEFARTGPTETVVRMVQLSAEMAPHEGWILVPRVALAAKLTDFHETAREVLRKDADALARDGQPQQVAAIFLQVGDRAREVLEQRLAKLGDPGRRAALQQAIDAIVATLPLERQP